MSGRITKAKREIILANVLSKTFDKKRKELSKELEVLAQSLYLHTYGDEQEIAKKLPKGWVSRLTSIDVDHEAFNKRYYGSKCEYAISDSTLPSVSVSLGAEFYGTYHNSTIAVSSEHPYYAPLSDYSSKYVTLNTAYEELKQSVEAILLSCTTFKRLEEAWPEYINYMDGMSITYTGSSLVPVGTAKKINNLITVYGV